MKRRRVVIIIVTATLLACATLQTIEIPALVWLWRAQALPDGIKLALGKALWWSPHLAALCALTLAALAWSAAGVKTSPTQKEVDSTSQPPVP